MIYYALHSPRMYAPAREGGDLNGCLDRCLAFLQDMARNGVCVVDDNGVISLAMAAEIDQWPEKYRKRGQGILEKLRADNRIIEAPAEDTVEKAEDVCRITEALSRSQDHDCLFLPSQCICGQGGTLCQLPQGTPISEYGMSFPERFREPTLVFSSGENGRFEREVLARVFRTAKWVRVIDRLIGSKAQQSDGSFCVPERFREGLAWLTTRLAKHSDKHRLGELTIVTEYPRRLDPPRKRLLGQLFGEFAVELRRGRAFDVRLRMLDSGRLPHNRYLLTDQVVLDIGQGFDLLDERGRLREMSVSLVSSGEFSKLTRAHPLP